MQGSFWKTVALVGVIGVGCLALLEVQNRLKNSPTALEAGGSAEDDSLARQLNAAEERQVNAELTDSDFDQLMKQGFSESSGTPATGGQGSFELSEPGAASEQTAQTFESEEEFSLADFNLSDPAPGSSDAANSNPQITTVSATETSARAAFGGFDAMESSDATESDQQVDPNALSEGNPFAAFDAAEVKAPANNAAAQITTLSPEDSAIQKTAFAGDDSSSTEADYPAFDPDGADEFATFEPQGSNTADTATASIEAMTDNGVDGAAADTQPAATMSPSASPAGQAKFFNGRQQTAEDSSQKKSVQASPTAFEQDSGGPEFEPFPGDDAQPDFGSAQPGALSDFGLETSPSNNLRQPDRLPSTELDSAPAASPFFGGEAPDPALGAGRREEPVPMPRDNGFAPESLNPIPDRGTGTFDGSSTGTQTLPFDEDVTPEKTPLSPVPDRFDEGGLAIPGAGAEPRRSPQPLDSSPRTFDADPMTEPARRELPNPAFNLREDTNPGPWPSGGGTELEPDFDRLQPERSESDRSQFDRSIPDVRSPRDPDFGNPRERREPISIEPRGTSPVRPESRDFDFDRTRTEQDDRRWDTETIDPRFDSDSGRHTFEERREPVRENSPLMIDPGFGESRIESERSMGREERFDREPSGAPIREFDGSRSLPSKRRYDDREVAPYGNSSTDTGPARGRRDFGRSSTDDRYETGRTRREESRIRQVASVMRPKLVLQKNAPENATVGRPLMYSILIRNDGDAPAYDVVVEDEATSAARVDAAEPQAERSTDGDHLIWEFDRIDPGAEEEIRVKVTPTGEGVIDGVATVKFKSRVKSTTMITAPRLTLDMEGPAKVRLGEKVQYRYTINNEGSGEARSVFVRTVLPQDGGLRHPQGQDLEYEIPILEPGEQREILLSVVAGDEGAQRATATVSSRNGSKANASWSTDVIGAQLQMLRRGPKRRFVGTPARYENLVTNETDFDCVNARVVERIPAGMEFRAAGQGGQYDPVNRTVTWEIRRLGAKATRTLQLELVPRKQGQHDSRVTILENIGAQSDDYVSTTVVEDLHNVSATMSQVDGPIAVGEVVGFTIKVLNRGTAQATDVELIVEVPEEMQVVSAGSEDLEAGLDPATNTIVFPKAIRIDSRGDQEFEMRLRAVRPGRNRMVKARLKYHQMTEALELSESVTIYDDQN